MSNPDFLSMNGNFGMLCIKGSRDLDMPPFDENFVYFAENNYIHRVDFSPSYSEHVFTYTLAKTRTCDC